MTSTLIQTPFGEGSTAAEAIEGGRRPLRQAGGRHRRRVGSRAETARALASAGALATFAVRGADAGERTATGIRKATGNDAVHVGPLDLAHRALIAAFTSATSAWSGSPHQRLFRPLSLGRPDPLIQVARGEAEFQALGRAAAAAARPAQ
ncbi:hypothetical protein N4G69_53855 [Streptomyces mirabilis]|uniref:hypothetical protein n=1 Tax=Streptomyces mirabilis TaxID=68239 RepID=UPI0021BF32FF|nr:hypothetical protein [Streptomyces mirabilis]MCT9114214.1 hypothetical protein [Streptomyces mirabilis]